MEKTLDATGRTVEYTTSYTTAKSSPSYSSVQGSSLAKNALHVRGTTGYCLGGVNDTLDATYGSSLRGLESAYMAADALRGKPVVVNGKTTTFKTLASKFTEISGVTREQLKTLPAGAIVVWNKGGTNVTANGKKHGHISIALGNGYESSDHIQEQITKRDTSYTVFFPKEIMT